MQQVFIKIHIVFCGGLVGFGSGFTKGFLRVLDRPEELEQGAVVYFDVPFRYAREPEGMPLQR